MYEHWNSICKINHYFFVVNDKYAGVAPPVIEKIIEEPDQGGQRMLVSPFSSLHERALVTHNNLLDVITPEEEE